MDLTDHTTPTLMLDLRMHYSNRPLHTVQPGSMQTAIACLTFLRLAVGIMFGTSAEFARGAPPLLLPPEGGKPAEIVHSNNPPSSGFSCVRVDFSARLMSLWAAGLILFSVILMRTDCSRDLGKKPRSLTFSHSDVEALV